MYSCLYQIFFFFTRGHFLSNIILFVTMNAKGIASYFCWPKNLYGRLIGLCNSHMDDDLYVFIYFIIDTKKIIVRISENV